MQKIERKNKRFNKKINDIDNYFKTIINTQRKDIDEKKRKIEEMGSFLSKKIT